MNTKGKAKVKKAIKGLRKASNSHLKQSKLLKAALKQSNGRPKKRNR